VPRPRQAAEHEWKDGDCWQAVESVHRVGAEPVRATAGARARRWLANAAGRRLAAALPSRSAVRHETRSSARSA